MKEDLKGIECRLGSIEKDLKEHMERSNSIERYVKTHDAFEATRHIKTMSWTFGVGIVVIIAFLGFAVSMMIKLL